MEVYTIRKKILFSVCCGFFLFSVHIVFAVSEMDMVRVHYRPDGGVSVSVYVSGACEEGETETACRDRIDATTPYAGLPHDDVRREDLPLDRKFRDKWRGEKGKGVWIDHSLITQRDKIDEYTAQLEEELDKETPNSSRVLKLQRMIEKVQDIGHSVLSLEDIDHIEFSKKRGFLASIVDAVGGVISSVVNGVKQGVLALASLVTDTLQVGTPEAPAGITVYDVQTKQPYCVVVRAGKIENIPGACGTVSIDPIPDEVTPVSAEPQNSSTPPAPALAPENVDQSEAEEESLPTDTETIPEPALEPIVSRPSE